MLKNWRLSFHDCAEKQFYNVRTKFLKKFEEEEPAAVKKSWVVLKGQTSKDAEFGFLPLRYLKYF